jgi:hypothetical protein
MIEWFGQLDFWHWWILGVGLGIIEIVAPGAFFLWLGVSAAATGFVLLIFPALEWEGQFLIFAVLSVASIVGWRVYLKRHPTATEQPMLNRRGEQYVGRTFTLGEPVVNGIGKIRVDDSTWKVEGGDMPAGTQIRVTGVEGTVFRIEEA